MTVYDFKVFLEPDETGGYVAMCLSCRPRFPGPRRKPTLTGLPSYNVRYQGDTANEGLRL